MDPDDTLPPTVSIPPPSTGRVQIPLDTPAWRELWVRFAVAALSGYAANPDLASTAAIVSCSVEAADLMLEEFNNRLP